VRKRQAKFLTVGDLYVKNFFRHSYWKLSFLMLSFNLGGCKNFQGPVYRDPSFEQWPFDEPLRITDAQNLASKTGQNEEYFVGGVSRTNHAQTMISNGEQSKRYSLGGVSKVNDHQTSASKAGQNEQYSSDRIPGVNDKQNPASVEERSERHQLDESVSVEKAESLSNNSKDVAENGQTSPSPSVEENVPAAHALDLYAALDLAFRHNPTTKIAWHQVVAAAAQNVKTKSVLYPRVGVSLNAARAEQIAGTNRDGRHLSTSISNVIFPQIDITYALFKFGAHREASLAALGALKAANFQWNQSLQDVAYKVSLAYFFLDSAMATVRANEQNLEDTQIALDAAENRYKSGLTNKQDLLKAQAAHSAAVFNFEHSRSTVEAARAQLARVIGIAVDEQLYIVESGEPSIPNMDHMEHCISSALATRQDLQAQREILRSKEHAWHSKKYDRYPEVVAGLSASRKKFKSTPGMYNNFEAYIGLKWDLFDGFSKMSDQIMAREEMKIAYRQLQAKTLDIRSQVWEYFYALKSAIRKLDAAKEAEGYAQEAFNCIKEAYNSGLNSFTDLLVAQNALSVARNKLVCARNDLAVGWVHLAYYAGKILEQ
jgi:outer membrane protein